MVWSFAMCPDDAKQHPVVEGAEFLRIVPGEGFTYSIHAGGPRLPRPLQLGD